MSRVEYCLNSPQKPPRSRHYFSFYYSSFHVIQQTSSGALNIVVRYGKEDRGED
jgi:hypothetical protein